MRTEVAVQYTKTVTMGRGAFWVRKPLFSVCMFRADAHGIVIVTLVHTQIAGFCFMRFVSVSPLSDDQTQHQTNTQTQLKHRECMMMCRAC